MCPNFEVNGQGLRCKIDATIDTANDWGSCPIYDKYLENMRENCITKNVFGLPTQLDLSAAADYMIELHKIKTPMPCKKFENMLHYNDGVYIDGGQNVCEYRLGRDFGTRKNFEGKELLLSNKKKEILEKIKERTSCEMYSTLSPVRVPTFDPDLSIINMCNGLYNWRTGEFKEHTPDYPSRIQVSVQYDPNATCPTIMEVIKDALQPSDVEKYLEFLAYVFYRQYDAIQKAVLFYGEAGTGKSQLIKLPVKLVGDGNKTSVSLHSLGGKMPDRYATAQMYEKLLNVAGEISSTFVPDVDIFKMLTSGSDPVHARMIYGSPFEFVNFAKLVMSANECPPVNDKSDAFYRRLEMFVFLRKFSAATDDASRLRALEDPSELSGIFNEVITRLPDLLERREFTNADSIESIKGKYIRMSNPVEMFANDCIREVGNPDKCISKEKLYRMYCKYCSMMRVPPETYLTFCRKVKHAMDWTKANERIRAFEGDQKHCWVNVVVIEPELVIEDVRKR